MNDWQIQEQGDQLLLGLSWGDGILDVVTTYLLLSSCRKALQPGVLSNGTLMGHFGPFEVTLNATSENTVSIFVDGPRFTSDRVMSAALFAEKAWLVHVLDTILGRA